MYDLDVQLERQLYVHSTQAAAREPNPKVRVEHLLAYIETCPTGAHNRDIAERIEAELRAIHGTARSKYHARYRRARDPFMPPEEPTARVVKAFGPKPD